MNQHYVPRAYLKNFSIKIGKGFYVDVYDKQENKYFKTNIKNICSEVDLYTLEEGNKIAQDLFIIEKIYSNGIEPLYQTAYQILTNHAISVISDVQRVEILLAIFQLYLRNPRILKRSLSFHKNEILKGCKEQKAKNAKGITYLGEDFSFRDYSEDQIVTFFENKVTKEFKEKHIAGIGEIANFHEHAKFDISVIRDNAEFITSDNPLVLEDSLTDNEDPMLRSKEFIIVLNKKVALRLYHDHTKHLNRIYRHYIPNGSVTMINNTILEQSTRFVIANKTIMDERARITKDFLDNTSTDIKIDMMRQVLSKFPVTDDNKHATDILRYYLHKYDTEGRLNVEDEYEMHIKLQRVKKEFIHNRIK